MQFPHAKWPSDAKYVHVFLNFWYPMSYNIITSCFRSTRSTLLCRMYRMYVQSSRNWSWLNLMNTHLIFMFIFSCRPVGWKDYLYYLSLQLQVCVAKCHPCDFEKRFWLLKSNFLSKVKRQKTIYIFICANWQTGCWILEEKSPEKKTGTLFLFFWYKIRQ